MKRLILVGLILLLVTPTFSQEIDLTGIWTGKLALPNSIELTVVFNLSKDDSEKYSTVLDSPDQGAKGIPTESTSIIGRFNSHKNSGNPGVFLWKDFL